MPRKSQSKTTVQSMLGGQSVYYSGGRPPVPEAGAKQDTSPRICNAGAGVVFDGQNRVTQSNCSLVNQPKFVGVS